MEYVFKIDQPGLQLLLEGLGCLPFNRSARFIEGLLREVARQEAAATVSTLKEKRDGRTDQPAQSDGDGQTLPAKERPEPETAGQGGTEVTGAAAV